MKSTPGNERDGIALADLTSGDRIGPYVVIGPLGHGGMGQVLLAHDARLQRKVALKRLISDDEQTPAQRDRILREARAAARISHPSVATVHDVLDHAGRTFIVMEYVEGESLAKRLSRGRLAASDVIAVGRQLAGGLAAAHGQGVIHRDLKPANIQVTPAGSIKILDFGVARTPPSGPAATEETTTEGSRDSVRGGTPVYMSPEQLLGHAVDERSDLYSLGMVLYEMAVGRRPYAERNSFELMLALSQAEPPSAHAAEPSVPVWLSAVIAKALARDPADRFESADAVARALDAEQVPLRVGPRRRFPARLAPVAVLLLAVAAAALVGTPAGRRLLSARSTMPTPVVLAVLPVENPGGELVAEHIAAGIESVVVTNLAALPGVTVVPRAEVADKRRDDLAALQRDLHAGYVIDAKLTAVDPRLQMVVRLRRSDGVEDTWPVLVAGDQLGVERQLIERLVAALRQSDRFIHLPTSSAAALTRYSQAGALIDRADVAGNLQRAVDLLKSAVAADPSFGIASAALADAYCTQYQRTRDPALVPLATQAANDALRTDPDSGQVYYSLANLQNVTGRRDDAIRSLHRAIQLQPGNDGPHRLLGLILADRGDVAGGVAEVKNAIAIRPQSWTNHNALGFIQMSAARYPDAAAAFRRVTELQPALARGYLMLGTALHKAGDTQQAIGNYEHAVRLGPTATAYTNLGVIYYGAGRLADAVRAFQAAVDLDSSSAVFRRNLGDAYLKAGETARARASWAQCVDLANHQLAINARDSATIALIALCEAKLGRRLEARSHGAEALALAPGDREVLYKNAVIAALLHDRPQALRRLREALDRGYQAQLAREDDDLTGLRTLEEFRRIVGPSQ